MFRKTSEQVEGLDQPLLDRSNANADDDDLMQGRDVGPPIAPHVGVLAVGPTVQKGYARVVDADESERSEREARERAQRMNAIAMERQKNNEVVFQKDMVELEERVVREAQERARIEENDRLLALRMQQEEESRGMQVAPMPGTTTMMVTVPQEARGGKMIAVQVPGHGTINIMVPNGLKPGDQFNFRIPTAGANTRRPPQQAMQQVAVHVPEGVQPGGTFRVLLPTNRILTVGVPAGCYPGDEVRVQYDSTSGVPNDQVATSQAPLPPGGQEDESIAVMESISETHETEQERKEREAFLAALPDDVRREVLAQETAQKRRLSAFGKEPGAAAPAPAPPPPPPQVREPAAAALTPEQMEFLRTLPEDLRGEVERDLRAQNAREGTSGRQNPSSSPRAAPGSAPLPASRPPPATPPSASGDADLLGLSTPAMTAYPSASLSQAPASAGGASPAGLDMFQNLSVRGVSKDPKTTRTQQQI